MIVNGVGGACECEWRTGESEDGDGRKRMRVVGSRVREIEGAGTTSLCDV
jgi:hypothetical protein